MTCLVRTSYRRPSSVVWSVSALSSSRIYHVHYAKLSLAPLKLVRAPPPITHWRWRMARRGKEALGKSRNERAITSYYDVCTLALLRYVVETHGVHPPPPFPSFVNEPLFCCSRLIWGIERTPLGSVLITRI
jgi:hypothetical protein